jgi:glyoxylase-like metal-dependent hydrolase (beta-lactamase superfamily II)
MFYPTPGRTVDHVAIKLQTREHRTVFSGDIMHQPLQGIPPRLE